MSDISRRRLDARSFFNEFSKAYNAMNAFETARFKWIFRRFDAILGVRRISLSALRQTARTSHYTAGIIRRMASRNNVTAGVSGGDRWAQDVTRLSGDDITFDDVEQLVVALQRAGILSRIQAVKLQARYLRENRP